MENNEVLSEQELNKEILHMIDLSAALVGDTISIERPLIELFHDPAPAILLTILMQRQFQCSAFDGFWPMDLTGIMRATRMNKEEADNALKLCSKYIRVETRRSEKEAYANIDIQSIRRDVRKALIEALNSDKRTDTEEEP